MLGRQVLDDAAQPTCTTATDATYYCLFEPFVPHRVTLITAPTSLDCNLAHASVIVYHCQALCCPSLLPVMLFAKMLQC